jgi:ribosomal protein L29
MKYKEIKNLNQEQRNKKLKELKLELIKTQAESKTGGSKNKKIRKIIARINTFNKSKQEKLKNK